MKMLHGDATRQLQASREFRTIVERHLWRENDFQPCTANGNINLSRTSRPPLCNRRKTSPRCFKRRACQLQIQFAFVQFLSIKIYFDSFEINLTSEREEHFTAEVSDSSFCSNHPQLTVSGSSPDKTRFNLTKLCSNCEILPQGPLKRVKRVAYAVRSASLAGAVKEIDFRHTRSLEVSYQTKRFLTKGGGLAFITSRPTSKNRNYL